MTQQPDVPEKGQLSLDGDGVLQLLWPRGASISEADAESAMARVNEMCGPTRRPMLVDMATTEKVSRGARAVFGRPCQASRIALLGSSPVDKVMANFVLGVTRQPCPTRFFTSRTEAMAWLTREA